MPDRYQKLAHSAVVGSLIRGVGLPVPAVLRRHQPGEPDIDGTVRFGAAPGTRITGLAARLTDGLNATVDADPEPAATPSRYRALVFDATGITDPTGLHGLYDFFHPTVARMEHSARVVVIGSPTGDLTEPAAVAAQSALDGFIRSIGKELRNGGTANLIRAEAGPATGLTSTLRYLLSGRSAFTSGQTIHIAQSDQADGGASNPLSGKVAVVTGAARGIGEVTVDLLARYGATVLCVDLPAASDALDRVAGKAGGRAIPLDLTADDAGLALAGAVGESGGADIIVHNAGITRDRSIVGMSSAAWDSVLAVNLDAPLRMTRALDDADAIHDGGRIVVMSSLMGIAGNMGQSNYAASKAGLIGMTRALAPMLAPRGITVNAVAPGFIETSMTKTMKTVVREGGRRLSSLRQGGLPIDVAETVAWFADPGSAGITGNVIRVCGQSLLGA